MRKGSKHEKGKKGERKERERERGEAGRERVRKGTKEGGSEGKRE